MWHLFFTVSALFFAFLSIPVITLLHELGHAVPALLFTSDTVTMYVGSYGDPEDNLKVKLGRLVILIKRNTVLWRQGICQHSSTGTIRQMIILASGPLSTFMIALALSVLAFTNDLHSVLKLFIVVFSVIAFLSFLNNIIPDNRILVSQGGATGYNDGFLLKSLLKYKSISLEFRRGVELFHAQKYREAVIVFKKIAHSGRDTADAYRFLILSCIYLNDLKKALHYHELLALLGELNAEDHSNGGLVKARLCLHEEAILEYNQCLSYNAAHFYCLNNRGYTYNQMGEYEKALADLNAAICLQSCYAYSYDNRGLSNLMLGQLEEGYADIQESLRLNDQSAYPYLLLGIYYTEIQDLPQALSFFQKAQAMDPTTPEVDKYIGKTLDNMEHSHVA
jgi:tetratricopeptide (TPR) repeat protein